MTARPQARVDSVRTPHPRTEEERCPLCNQTLPHDLTAAELQSRLKAKEEQARRLNEQRLRERFEKDLSTKIEETKRQAAAKAAEREKTIRLDAEKQAAKAMGDALAKAQEAARKAQEEKSAADENMKRLKDEHAVQLKEQTQKAVTDLRETLEKDKLDAIHKAKAEEFEKGQRLQKQVGLLKRQLEQQTAEARGEGAEIDLYEALRESFDHLGDKITRIKKGKPGADILHEVRHNGQVCGLIVYDSKNHARWRENFVSKLRNDQIAARADHGILTTAEFPRGERQLVVRDGVIVINPARAVEVVRLVREHVVQAHRLRLSAKERSKKTEALYTFINSDRCRQLLEKYESITEKLLKIDEKETSAHRLVWKKRGELLREAQKTHADYRTEIDRIIEDEELA